MKYFTIRYCFIQGKDDKILHVAVTWAAFFQKDISLFLTTLAGKVQIIKTQIMKPASSQNRVYSTRTFLRSVDLYVFALGKVEAPLIFRGNGAFGEPCRAQIFGSGAQVCEFQTETGNVPPSPGQPPDAVAPKPKGRCRQVGLHLVEPDATE